MAPVKRKAVTDDRPTKKAKASNAEAGSSRVRREEQKDEDSSERRPVKKSLLQQEEKAFPRGGASILTPLEHKQIKAQAEQDVLFEQQTGRPTQDEDEERDLFENKTTAAPPKKKTKRRRESNEAPSKPEKSNVRIQGLSYKNLVVGSVVLGYVTTITSRDVALALANNLTGYAPITSISEKLNARIKNLLDDDEDEEANEKGEEEDVDLKKLFYVGQWLRATVTSTGSESTDHLGKTKRHIELSIDPKQVNGGLEAESLVSNSMIQASVRSVEDHGIVMDLGVADSEVKGFVSKKELGSAYKLDEVQEGQVMMCLVTGKGSNGKVLKLSPDAARFSVLDAGKGAPSVSEAPTVDGFQPGTAVDVLITESGGGGVVGKIMGMLDVTADITHSGAGTSGEDIGKRYKIGSKVKGRIIWAIPTDDGSRRIGISLLDHMLALPPPSSKLPENASAKLKLQSSQLDQTLPLSTVVEGAKVKHVLAERGLFLALPGEGDSTVWSFAHIAQISDSRIDSLTSSSGAYKLDSLHRARVLSYNPMDNLYQVSLKQSILDQPFLRIEDLSVGGLVKGTVERLILGAKGINGVLVKLSDNITGLVPELHLSDVQLQHPERKFKEGLPVKARVLNVDLDKRYVRLTLKKTLVSQDEALPIWKDYSNLQPNMESKGTIVNLLPNGAAVQFFGNVRAWLPVAEMSETYIDNPEKHFRLGQTVNARIVSVDPGSQEMKVSCKAQGLFGSDQQEAWDQASGGDLVSGVVTEKGAESVTVELQNGLKGLIRVGHLSDGSEDKAEKALKKIHIGKALSHLLVLDKLERSRHLLLTKKSSLVEDAQTETLLRSFPDVKEGRNVNGFVRNVTPEGVYVEFANGIVGFMPKSQISSDMVGQPAFGIGKDQSVKAWVWKISAARDKFTLSTREQKDVPPPARTESVQTAPLSNVVDKSITSMADITLGKITKVRVASVKATQINVRLADNVQGRIDVSEVFDSWDEVTNKRAPLQKFKANEVLDVKILGIHDARSHRFLPISHRQSTVPVFELSAKPSRIDSGDETGLTMDSIKAASTHLAFVNNHGDNCVWVNLSPNVRGRIALMDLSDDVGRLQNLSKGFPIGCGLQVTVKNVDALANRLDLVAKSGHSDEQLSLQTISPGMVLAGRVTKLTERSVHVQLSENLGGPVPLVEIADDYDQLNLAQHHKNEIVRVCVLEVDLPNKRIYLSLRPSKVLSSSLPVKDSQITNYKQLKPGALIRGFVKHVGEKGVHVSLGARVDAFVRISDLSDQYIKDWKSVVEIDQLVKGRILAVNEEEKHVLLSLKSSHVDEDYKAPITINDLRVGMTVTGKVRKVEDFGAFIDIDNTRPRLSGLCHRSEVAEKRVEDVRKLYSEGDIVKARVLSVDVSQRKISLGLKASYFTDVADEDDAEENEDSGVEVDAVEVGAIEADEDDNVESDIDDDIDLGDVREIRGESDSASEFEAVDVENDEYQPSRGLKTTGFDWTGQVLAPAATGEMSDSEPDTSKSKKRKRHKAEIKLDLTGDLDRYGPRSVSDFERQLLGQPNDSALWVQYMAFQLQLSEVQKARDIAERAFRTIHIREVEEKANVWIALLNLEVEYGDDDRVEDVFKQACQVQDSLDMHEKLASIYIDSGKHGKADAMFERIVGNKSFRASPEVWLNYAHFLMDTLKAPERAHSLLSRALQSVPTNEHRLLTAKFAALEFRSSQGDPERGRTIFEGLVSEWPNWSSGWDMFVDLERSRATTAQENDVDSETKERIRAIYVRMASQKMKKRRAKFVFKRWLEFEEKFGNEKAVERVKARANEYVESQRRLNAGDDSAA